MGRARRGTSSSRTSTLLLVALGAVAGLAIGMAVADRVGGVGGMLRRTNRRRVRSQQDAGWDEGWDAGWDGLDAPMDDDTLDATYAPAAGTETDAATATGAVMPAATAAAPTAAPSRPSAEELEQRVLEVFRNDPLLATRNVDIGADHHGRVELTGWVEERREVDYALTLVRGVPDVTGVMSNLMIRRRAAG